MDRSVLFCLLLVLQAAVYQPLPTGEDGKGSAGKEDGLHRLESLLLAQDLRQARQEILLSQLNERVFQQELELSWQSSFLRHQERLNRQQAVELGRLKAMLSRYEKQIVQQEAEKLNGGLQSLCDDRTEDWGSLNAQGNARERTSFHHKVMTRSDDESPLEGVVNEVSNRMSTLTADLESMRDSNSQRDIDIQDARTSTFVRWGSSSCPASAQLVYSGAMGGSWYLHSGAATNYLCLTLNPLTRPNPLTTDNYLALLYGVEFQTLDRYQDSDPVCSVCRSSFSTTIMVPGTDTCLGGWNLQYSGFIMAGNYHYPSGSQYLCVDSQLETSQGSHRNDNGRLLDYVVTRCGSLPCGPYVNDTLVTCAVCSK